MNSKNFNNTKSEPRLSYYTKEDWNKLENAAKLVGLTIPRRRLDFRAFVNSEKSIKQVNHNKLVQYLSDQEKVRLFCKLGESVGVSLFIKNAEELGSGLNENFTEEMQDHFIEYLYAEGKVIDQVQEIPEEELQD